VKLRAEYCAIVASALLAPVQSHAQDQTQPPAAENVCEFVSREMGSRIWWPSYGKSGWAHASFVTDQGDTAAHGDFRDNYSVRYGVFDIDGDGRPDRIQPTGYQMNSADTFHIIYSTGIDGEWAKGELPGNRFTSPMYEGWWLPYRGRMYELAFDDREGAYISTVAYFNAKGKHLVCGFENKFADDFWRGSVGEKALSQKDLTKDHSSKVADFLRLHGLPTPIAAAKVLPGDLRQSVEERGADILAGGTKEEWQVACDADPCKVIWELDFNNDGKPDRLVKFRNGENEAFLLMEKNGLAPLPDQKLLPEELNSSSHLRRNWVLIGGRYYLERKGPLYHDLFLYLADVEGRFVEATVKVEPTITYERLSAE